MRLIFAARLIAVTGIALGLGAAASAGVAQTMPPGVAQDLDSLTNQPATHMGYSFDRSQIEQAQQMLESGGLPADHAALALDNISFDTYRFKQPAFYTPEAMAAIVDAYHRAGWKHLVEAGASPAESAQPRSALTDVWLHFRGPDIDHVTVLIRGRKDMNLIQIAGDLRPMDLLHLSGHFGIPKVDPSAVMVPAPDGR